MVGPARRKSAISTPPPPSEPDHSFHRRVHPRYSLRRDYLLLALLAGLVLLSLGNPGNVPRYFELVDWPTIAALLGLMILTKGVELSGALHHLGHRIVLHIGNLRLLALFLVAVSALAATVLTNDIALFIVVPLTLGLAAFAELPLRRLVIFEALAVNSGSMLSPVGNPQNIFLWQLSGAGVGTFLWRMLPPVAVACLCLLLLTLMAFPARRIRTADHWQLPPIHYPLLLVAAVLYVPFLVLADRRHAEIGLTLVAAVFLVRYRSVLLRLDWPLMAVFLLMFIDLRLLAAAHWVLRALGHLDLQQPLVLYATGALLSQVISNVPSAILLARYSNDWQTLAWAVDVGGFGLVTGSLASLIALRLGRQRGSLLAFHAWSLPFFLVVGTLTGLWLAAR